MTTAADRIEADAESRGMFVARLENMQRNGDRWLTIEAVLALLNDCDMLASIPTVGTAREFDTAKASSDEPPSA